MSDVTVVLCTTPYLHRIYLHHIFLSASPILRIAYRSTTTCILLYILPGVHPYVRGTTHRGKRVGFAYIHT
ncbi:hypothetical protein BDV38DRAFT_256427 [Aspergillus pseudotamarii]|uniref:Uncharacterized protein n=1 Tax=Aspergillus pseudotamarii TaxID=132259 RepID=A0A5N6SKV0_ASPPS|nr:uncharacterized protein BDV38DRAFT_256427 [Aspergillus pseudotamarii]KAE8134013.1 hypothetical protein BDV38DRAFT_256427 [Aspergillus pseudotamarii]